MDAKVNFINSVADGQQIPCPVCNTLNDADAMFCGTCGNRLKPAEEPAFQVAAEPAFQQAAEPAFQQAAEPVFQPAPEKAFQPASEAAFRSAPEPAAPAARVFHMAPPVEEEPEEVSPFANGLPDWDIVPPQVMVRRKAKK